MTALAPALDKRIRPRPGHRALYAAFDVYPSAKGAATHIHAFARTLFDYHCGGVLYTLGNDELPVHQDEEGVEIFRFCRPVKNVLDRSLAFGGRLAALVRDLGDSIALAHFRDPFSGIPILEEKRPRCRTVYEVNGLPSVELPARYPAVGPRTRDKLRALEDHCLKASDVIVTPAVTLKRNLEARGVPGDKIVVIENGADPPPQAERPDDAPPRYIVYMGGVQPWQGIDVLLRALARLDPHDLHLVICASTGPRTCRPLARLARRLGVEDRVRFAHQLNKEALAAWLRHAAVSVAPLTECARNLDQGCCPLKILESMAAGVPVVASDLPSVRELVEHDHHALLVPAERPAALARALRALLDDPARAAALAATAREHVQTRFSWDRATARLRAVYDALADGAPTPANR